MLTAILAHDHGGVLSAYAAKFTACLLAKCHVVIAGLCASACTLALGLPPDQVCATPEAVLAFHEASAPSGTELLFAVYPPALQARLGPLGAQVVTIRAPEIWQFVKECGAWPIS